MNEDLRFLVRFAGWIPTAVGAVVVSLGTLYASMGWRFGGAFRAWSWMWGFMLAGLGLIIMSTGRRWMAWGGVLLCGTSGWLVFWWERHIGALESWWRFVYGADALGIAFAVVAIAFWTWRRVSAHRRSPVGG